MHPYMMTDCTSSPMMSAHQMMLTSMPAGCPYMCSVSRDVALCARHRTGELLAVLLGRHRLGSGFHAASRESLVLGCALAGRLACHVHAFLARCLMWRVDRSTPSAWSTYWRSTTYDTEVRPPIARPSHQCNAGTIKVQTQAN